MKLNLKLFMLVCILLVTSACILLTGKKTPSPVETEDVAATITPTDPAQVLDPCTLLDLSPEECANIGTHTYEFTTEFSCPNTASQKIEKITIIFADSSVQVQKIEPVTEE